MGISFSLPMMMPLDRYTPFYECMHPLPPYPVYNLQELAHSQENNALICASVKECEYVRGHHAYLLKDVTPTTWSGGLNCTVDGTDWGILRDHRPFPPVIMVSPSKEGFIRANRVHKALLLAGHQHVAFAMPYARLEQNSDNSRCYDADIMRIVAQGGVCDYSKFAAEANKFFGLEFVKPQEMGLSGHDLMTLGAVPPKYVLKPIVRERDKVLVYGGTGCAKSWFTTALAIGLATGTGLFEGKWPCERPLKVGIFYCEMSTGEISGRYKDLAGHFPPSTHDRIRVITTDYIKVPLRLDSPESRARYEDLCAWLDVMVVDGNYKAFPTAMGNDIAGVQPLLDFLDHYSSLGKTIFIVDHAGKDPRRGAMGSAGKNFSFDMTWYLEKKSDGHFGLSIEKYRADENSKANNISFRLVRDVDKGMASLKLASDVSANPKTLALKVNPALPEGAADMGGTEVAEKDLIPCREKSSDVNSILLETASPANRFTSQEERISAVKECYLTNPGISVREAEKILGISKSTINDIRRKLIDGGELPVSNSLKGNG